MHALALSLLLAVLPRTHAAEPGACQSVFHGLLDIDDAGQVRLGKEAQGKFDIDAAKNPITVTGRTPYTFGQIITIKKDGQGRAISIQQTQSPIANLAIPFMFLASLHKPVTHLNYADGKCAVGKITDGKRVVVDTAMCGELMKIFKARGDCRSQCDAGVADQVKGVIAKYQGDTEEAAKLEQTLSLTPSKTEMTQAHIYLQRCASPAIAPSIKTLAAAAPAPTPAATPTAQ